MLLILLIAAIIVVFVLWYRREQRLNPQEIKYLKTRGYEHGEDETVGPPPDVNVRLFSLIQSLSDVSAYSREKAAHELLRMCEEGKGDRRMLSGLISALDDRVAAVRTAAARALGSLGDPDAVEPLSRVTELDESVQVRLAARSALERIQQDQPS